MDGNPPPLTKWAWLRIFAQGAMSIWFFLNAMYAEETFDQNFKFVGSAVFALVVTWTLIERRIKWQ
jgi:hypothetical protein